MSKKTYLTLILTISLLHVPFYIPAWGGMKEVKVSDSVRHELNYLLSFVGPEKAAPHQFTSKGIENVLDFVATSKESDVLYHAGKFNGSPSAYYQFDIHRDLTYILRLAYHPNIPSVVTSPSSLRMSHWAEFEGQKRQPPKLWKLLPGLEKPIILTGIEHMVNSPDEYSGSYYEYDLDRTLILFKHRGRNVLISMSQQKGISDVSRQGLVLGPDDNWDYIYTGKPGIAKSGFSWVRSYMYDSYSIAFYSEIETGKPMVRFGVFKWLRAGFQKINFARRSNIYKGIIRFADVFKEVLESPGLPDPTTLAQTCREIEQLSDEQLQQIVAAYLKSIELRCQKEDLISKKREKELFANQHYLNLLDRQEMESIVILEYVKQMLGKNQATKLTYLPTASDLPK